MFLLQISRVDVLITNNSNENHNINSAKEIKRK